MIPLIRPVVRPQPPGAATPHQQGVISTVVRGGFWANEVLGVQVGSLYDELDAAFRSARATAQSCELAHRWEGEVPSPSLDGDLVLRVRCIDADGKPAPDA